MTIDDIVQWVREMLDSPQKALVRLWVVWWIFSSIRNALKKRSGAADRKRSPPEGLNDAEAAAAKRAEAEASRAPAPRPTAAPRAATPAVAPRPADPRAASRPPVTPRTGAGPRAEARPPPAPETAQRRGLAGAGQALVEAARRRAADAARRAATAAPHVSGAPSAERQPSAARSISPGSAWAAAREAAQAARNEDPGAAWGRALERAYALQRRIEDDASLQRLEPVLRGAVVEPIQTARDHASRRRPSEAAEARGASALLTLEVLERIADERAREPDRAHLAELDAILEAAHAPLRRHAETEGLALRGRYPFALRAPLPEAQSSRQWTDQLLLVPVARSAGARLIDHHNALSELGRRWFFSLPELPEEVWGELDLAQRVRLPDPRVSYDENSVRASFGPWLPVLFADVALTLRLGAGHVAGLVRGSADEDQVTRARSDGAYLSPQPPTAVRMRVALATLTSLGQGAEAERQRESFRRLHPATEQSYLPLSDGRLLVLPTAYLFVLSDELSSFLLESRLDALGGVPLGQLPALTQTIEVAREQGRVAKAALRGPLPAHVDAALLLGAALLAWQDGGEPDALLARLHERLAPQAAPTRGPKRGRAARAVGAPRTLHAALRAALRDPARLRSAIAIGAAFEPPRSRRSPP